MKILADELVAANRGAEHVALLGVIVAIGLLVFAVSRWRRRHKGETVDELSTSEHDKPVEESRPPAEQGDLIRPRSKKRQARPR